MCRMVDVEARTGNGVAPFAMPAIAFASLFGFRFVSDETVSDVRGELIAVAALAGAASLIGTRHISRTVAVFGRPAASTLVIADIVIAAGAAIGVVDVYRHRAPYLVGWFIDVAALGWVGAAVMAARAWRLGQR